MQYHTKDLFGACAKFIISLHASGNFCRLLIFFANKNVRPDLDPKFFFDILMVFLKEISKKLIMKIIRQQKKLTARVK